MADEKTATSDLALEAAKNALALTGRPLEEAALSLDLIIVATGTPDYYGSPATACIVQDKLGAKNAAAMDITAACTGFVYGLEIAAGLLSVSSSRKRALLIGSELLTRFANWDDRSSCVLFGDGAGAVLIEKTENPSQGPEKRGLIRSILSADGSGAEHIIFKRGGSKEPFKSGETLESGIQIQINGQAVYNFAVQAVTETIKKILSLEGISIDDVNWIIPHQANARIVIAAAKRLKIPEERFYLNIEEYANTSSASIPIALDELNRGGKIKKGDLVLTIGFGGGLTYGANLIVW
jgi:3-oxoacyl-[acyl-carrier-protein] synthase-3